MNRISVLKIVNPVLGVLVLNQVLTGVLHGVLPRDLFQVLHQASGLAVAAVVALHVGLNWNWIKANYFRR